MCLCSDSTPVTDVTDDVDEDSDRVENETNDEKVQWRTEFGHKGVDSCSKGKEDKR